MMGLPEQAVLVKLRCEMELMLAVVSASVVRIFVRQASFFVDVVAGLVLVRGHGGGVGLAFGSQAS
jgi:hypothetical protein